MTQEIVRLEDRGIEGLSGQRIRNGVQELELKSWKNFFDLTTKYFNDTNALIYRGQTDYGWPLKSSLDRHRDKHKQIRKYPNGEKIAFDNLEEEMHLSAFKRAICGRKGSIPQNRSDEEWWSLGQHYGLATRFLDWTLIPFVALFFAFEQEKYVDKDKLVKPEYRGVYILSDHIIDFSEDLSTRMKETIIEKENEDCSEDEINLIIKERKKKEVYIVTPKEESNYRLMNQQGIFTFVPEGESIEEYIKKTNPDEKNRAILTKIKIPNKERDECLITLKNMNISYMTMFSDIHGVAKHINQMWIEGYEDSTPYIPD